MLALPLSFFFSGGLAIAHQTVGRPFRHRGPVLHNDSGHRQAGRRGEAAAAATSAAATHNGKRHDSCRHAIALYVYH